MDDEYADPNDDFVRGYNAGLKNGGIARELLRARIAELEASIDANDEWAKGFIEKTDARIAELEAGEPACFPEWLEAKNARIAELEAENAELRLRLFSMMSLLPDGTTCGEVRAARAALEKTNG